MKVGSMARGGGEGKRREDEARAEGIGGREGGSILTFASFSLSTRHPDLLLLSSM